MEDRTEERNEELEKSCPDAADVILNVILNNPEVCERNEPPFEIRFNFMCIPMRKLFHWSMQRQVEMEPIFKRAVQRSSIMSVTKVAGVAQQQKVMKMDVTQTVELEENIRGFLCHPVKCTY